MEATDIYWVEVSDAIKHLVMHRTGLPTNNNTAQNVSSDVVENHIVDRLNHDLWGLGQKPQEFLKIPSDSSVWPRLRNIALAQCFSSFSSMRII